MRLMWVLATVVILVTIPFFAVWRSDAADDDAMKAERERIRRLMAEHLNQRNKNHI